jgi:hypothetical protein
MEAAAENILQCRDTRVKVKEIMWCKKHLLFPPQKLSGTITQWRNYRSKYGIKILLLFSLLLQPPPLPCCLLLRI